MGVEDVEKYRALVDVLDVLNLLSNVLGGGTNTTNGQEDVVLEEVAGKHLDVTREGRGEHQSLTVGHKRHVLAFNNAANLGLETHVKHAISLIENEVLDVAKRNAATLYEVHKTTRGRNEEITATLDLAKLGANVGTTVDNARADPGAVGELARLFVNLRDQLTGGSQNEGGRVCLALAAELSSSASGSRRRTVEESLGENGEEETTSLSRTSLGTSHEITTAGNDRDGVLLNRCGDLVTSKLDVAAQMLIERGSGKLENRLGNIISRSLNRDVVVLLEVDASVLLGRIVGSTEELALDAGVGRTRDVLAVLPLAIARAASSVATAGAAVATFMTTVASTAATSPAAAAWTAVGRRSVVA